MGLATNDRACCGPIEPWKSAGQLIAGTLPRAPPGIQGVRSNPHDFLTRQFIRSLTLFSEALPNDPGTKATHGLCLPYVICRCACLAPLNAKKKRLPQNYSKTHAKERKRRSRQTPHRLRRRPLEPSHQAGHRPSSSVNANALPCRPSTCTSARQRGRPAPVEELARLHHPRGRGRTRDRGSCESTGKWTGAGGCYGGMCGWLPWLLLL